MAGAPAGKLGYRFRAGRILKRQHRSIGMVERLSAGQTLPATTIALSDGSSMTLPDDMGDGYKVILFFRGSW
jgi:hypothetical protein